MTEIEDIDFSSSANKLAENAINRIFSVLGKAGKTQWSKLKNRRDGAFSEYIQRRTDSVRQIKNIVYAQPVDIEKLFINVGLSRAERDVRFSLFRRYCFLSSRRIVISATAGAGKSFLLKQIFVSALEQSSHTSMFPIFIECRKLSGSEVSDIEIAMENEVMASSPGTISEQVQLLAKAGTLLVFLDGLDELEPSARNATGRSIQRFLRKYPKNSIVATSRKDTEVEHWEQFEVFEIQPLSQPQVIELVQKLDFEPQIKNEFINEVKSSLFELHYSFLSSPLLATIMLITFGEHGTISSKRSQFYYDAYTALYQSHDLRKGGYKRKRYTTLDREEFFQVFCHFCVRTYLLSEFSFKEDELIIKFRKSLDTTQQDVSAEAFLQDLLISVCLLVRDGTRIEFSHRSFQEFFAASFISRLETENALMILDLASRRSDTDQVIELVRELNPRLVESLWIGPYLEQFDIEFSIDDRAKVVNFIHGIVEYKINDQGDVLEFQKNRFLDIIRVIETILQVTEGTASFQRIRDICGALAEDKERLARFYSKGIMDFEVFLRPLDSAEQSIQADLMEAGKSLRKFLRFARGNLRERHRMLDFEINDIIESLE